MVKRKFIEIEGPEFSGKSTLCNAFINAHKDFELVRLPGYTPLGESIRQKIKYDHSLSPKVSFGLIYASHMSAYEAMAKADKDFIVDRAFTSILVYQGIMGGLWNEPFFKEGIKDINHFIHTHFEHHTYVMSITAKEILTRRNKAARQTEIADANDKYDNLSETGFTRMIDAYTKAYNKLKLKNKAFIDATWNTTDQVEFLNNAIFNPK